MQNILASILLELGMISGRLGSIERRQQGISGAVDRLTLQVDRLEQLPMIKKPTPRLWETERFWLVVMAIGAALAGAPDVAKMLIR